MRVWGFRRDLQFRYDPHVAGSFSSAFGLYQVERVVLRLSELVSGKAVVHVEPLLGFYVGLGEGRL